MTEPDSITVGKYRISPLIRMVDNGWYTGSVSIRSHAGCCAPERVLRLTRLFRERVAALRYATGEGLRWIGHRGQCQCLAIH
jgi:hypothetical protein